MPMPASSNRWHIEEYRGFFQIGMVERNEHNAIIQHGTMTIVRKDALEAVGGWGNGASPKTPNLGCACSKRATRRPIFRKAWARG